MIEKIKMTNDVKNLVNRFNAAAARKRSFYASVFSPMDLDSYWSGGSRDYFHIVELATGKAFDVASNHPFFEKDNPRRLNELPAGYVVIRIAIFCGKLMPAHLYVNSEDMPRWIEAKETV